MNERCNEVDAKIDAFKDAYVKNNKEFLQLSFIVGELRDVIKEHMENTEKYKIKREEEDKTFRAELQPLLDWYKGITFSKRLLWGSIAGAGVLAGAIGAVMGAIYAVKKLFM